MSRAEQFSRLFFQFSREYEQYMERELAPHLTAGQLVVLEFVSGKERVKPSDLSPYLKTSAAAVTMLLDRMAKNGLIERVRDENDRRIVWIRLTPKGKSALQRGTSIRERFFQEALASISAHNQRLLLYLFGKLASPSSHND